MALLSTCPSTEALQRYAANELPPDQMLTITKHLVRCKYCNDDVQILRRASVTLTSPIPTNPYTSSPSGHNLAGGTPHPGSSTEIRPQPAPRTDGRGSAPSPATQNLTDAKHSSAMCSFLSPSQREDEIGRLGPYRVLKVLGYGGMGIVFEAEDEALQRKIALKTLHANLAADSTSRQRFIQEGRSAAAVDHENVVTIFQVGEANDIPYLAMQFLHGRSLESKLRVEKQLTTRDILRIGQEIAQGLAAAHKLRLVHRDIKPSNIWLVENQLPNMATPTDGRVKILDFGLARAMEPTGPALTQQGLVVGTAGYMSPEQARGHSIDPRSDLYSLGCILYEMSTGRLPLEGPDPLATLMATMLDKPEPPLSLNPGLPTPLSDLIMRLLAKNPDERPSTASSLAQQLARLAQGPAASLDELRARLLGGKK